MTTDIGCRRSPPTRSLFRSGGVEKRSDSENRDERASARTARLGSMTTQENGQDGELMLRRSSVLNLSDSAGTRGYDRARVEHASVAAIARANRRRSELRVTSWREVAASTPCATQHRPVGSNSKCQYDGENGEPQHGDRCLETEQDRGHAERFLHTGSMVVESGNQRGILRSCGENSPPLK